MGGGPGVGVEDHHRESQLEEKGKLLALNAHIKEKREGTGKQG